MDEHTPEENLVIRLKQMLDGDLPIGTLDLLHILAHPDVIDLTWAWLESKY